MNTSPDCVSAGLGIDVIEAEDVPNVRDLFEAWWTNGGKWPFAAELAPTAFDAFQAGYRAAGGQGA